MAHSFQGTQDEELQKSYLFNNKELCCCVWLKEEHIILHSSEEESRSRRLLEVIQNFVCLYSFYVKPDHYTTLFFVSIEPCISPHKEGCIESTNIDCYVSPTKRSLLETDKKCILRLTDKKKMIRITIHTGLNVNRQACHPSSKSPKVKSKFMPIDWHRLYYGISDTSPKYSFNCQGEVLFPNWDHCSL